jgi:hypothetical protein
MTRILMHPHLLPRYTGSRVQLDAPWRWWGCRVYPGTDGNLFHQQYDNPTSIREASILFLDEQSVEIVDPPAMNLVVELPDLDVAWGDPLRTVREYGPRWGECQVVWHSQPGPRWLALPGNTCLLSQYRVDTVDRAHRRDLDDSSMRLHYASDMPSLALVLAHQRAFQRDIEELAGSYQTGPQRYMTPHEASHVQEVYDWHGNLVGLLQDAYTPNEVREREGLPRYMPSVIKGGRSPSVLPESEVIAEIDRLEDYFDTRDEAEAAVRLVNEQVRGGPVDDYKVDRYPRCKECGHTWHGLECSRDNCDCINTDWLNEQVNVRRPS